PSIVCAGRITACAERGGSVSAKRSVPARTVRSRRRAGEREVGTAGRIAEGKIYTPTPAQGDRSRTSPKDHHPGTTAVSQDGHCAIGGIHTAGQECPPAAPVSGPGVSNSPTPPPSTSSTGAALRGGFVERPGRGVVSAAEVLRFAHRLRAGEPALGAVA